MFKKTLSFLLSLIIILGSFIITSSAADDFVPVLRFIVASDVHIADSGSDMEEQRLAKLFNASYSYAQTQSYKSVDGAFFVGDISDRGTQSSLDKFFSIISKNVHPETKVRAVLGNHEFYTDSDNTVSRFLSASGYSEADTDFVMGGYHFIMICPQNGGRGYTSGQKSWLKKRLSEDAKEDSTKKKPIFVFQHHNVSDTVYGSEAWGIDEISSLLSQYPQVVDFSGHSHFPINDPRSIWQGSFTAVNDGTLTFYEMGIAGVIDSDIYPSDHMGGYSREHNHRDAAQYCIVEVNRNNAIRIKGYDLISDTFISEYNIPSVGNTNEFIYKTDRKNTSPAPVFSPSAEINLKGTRTDAAVFEIEQASCIDPVQHYRFDVYDVNNKLISTEYTLSDTFYLPTPTTLRCVVKGLQNGTAYIVKCFAVNCWEKESQPLTLRFKTKDTPDVVSCYDSPVTPDVFSFIQMGNSSAYDGVSGKELSRDGEPIVYYDSVTGRYGAEFNGINTYRFDSFKDFYATMQTGVSFEYYGVIDDTDVREGAGFVDIFSNQEGGGCGFELSGNGLLEFYVYVGGRYVHPGVEIELNKPVHLVGTFDRRSVKLYVNGQLAVSENASGLMSFPSDEDAQFLCIGGDSDPNGKTEACFTGTIVTANVYGRALTATEVERLFGQYSTFDFITESGYQFDSDNKILYGLNLTSLTADNIKNAFRNTNLFVETDSQIGTGTGIVLKNSRNEIYDTAEIVIFGDVNGDGWYDGTDAAVVNCIVNGMLSENDIGRAKFTAADCNHDGIINNLDVEILEQAGVLLARIDQTKTVEELLSTSSEYNEYLNLIKQNGEFTAESDSSFCRSIAGIIKSIIKALLVILKISVVLLKLCFG